MSESKRAVALHYNGQDTPTVTATGSGQVADDIIEFAREHDIAIMENRELLALLASLDVGDDIPSELFEVVAQILALSIWMRTAMKEQWHPPITDLG